MENPARLAPLLHVALPGTYTRTDDDLLHWLALRLTPGVGAKSGMDLLARFGSPQALFRAGAAELEAAGAHPGVARGLASGCSFEEAADQLERCKSAGIRLLTIRDDEYPEPLRQIYDPMMLFARGKLELLGRVKVAIVAAATPPRMASQWPND